MLAQEPQLNWSGVEIAGVLREKIAEKFHSAGRQYDQLVENVGQLRQKDAALYLFVYALDSMPPEVFINTGKKTSAPNALLGVRIQNGMLQEVVLSHKELAQRKMSLAKGVMTIGDERIDLSSWHLMPQQRAYIPMSSLVLLSKTVSRAPKGSRICIIDEFRKDKGAYVSPHLLVPRDPRLYRRDKTNIRQNYEHIGTIDYYFPQYSYSLQKYLASLGVSCVLVDSEMALSAYMKAHHKLPRKPLDTESKTQCFITNTIEKRKKKVVYPLRPEDMHTHSSWEW